jgi:hypothetical protein
MASLTFGASISLAFDHHRLAVLEFCLLGPLVVWSGQVALAAAGQAAGRVGGLLLNAGRAVSLDELVEDLC